MLYGFFLTREEREINTNKSRSIKKHYPLLIIGKDVDKVLRMYDAMGKLNYEQWNFPTGM